MTDALNETEEHVAHIGQSSVNPNSVGKPISDEEYQIRNCMLEAMRLYQTERHRVHSVIKEHGLTGLHLSDRDFQANSKFTPTIYRPLSSIADFKMLEGLIAGVNKETEIRNKIKKLEKQKTYGVHSKIDQVMFEKLDVGRRIDAVKTFYKCEHRFWNNEVA